MSGPVRAVGQTVMTSARKHSISGLVAEYIVAIDVTQARFPADAVGEM